MKQRTRQLWRIVGEPFDRAIVVVVAIGLIVLGVIFLVTGSKDVQTIGGIVLGGGLTAFIGTMAGRYAVRQESGRQANLARKRETYGPLYAELKALRTALSESAEGKAPAPQWINDGIETEPEGVAYMRVIGTDPTLTCWPEFRRDYRDTDFKAETQTILDQIQAQATTYNNAVSAARVAAMPILGSSIESAIAAERKTERHQEWRKQQAAHAASGALAGQQLKTKYNWFLYFDDEAGMVLATRWLTYWPGGSALGRSQALGWLLAEKPDKAASYVQRQYPVESGVHPQPELDFIQSIFEQAWPVLEQSAEIRAALDAKATLLTHVKEAETILEDGLRLIQDRHEGGEPLV